MDGEALVHFVGGAVGGTAGTALTCPLEVIKTRIQSSTYKAEGENGSANSKPRVRVAGPSTSNDSGRIRFARIDYSTLLNVNRRNVFKDGMVLKSGFKVLIKVNPNLARSSFDQIFSVRHAVGPPGQVQPRKTGTFALLRFVAELVKTEGFRALYKGLMPNIVGVAPSKAIYFYTYSSGKRFWNQSDVFVPNSAITHMLSAGFAGFVTATAINPVWLVKTRLQLHHGPLTVRNCIRKIYKTDGFRGFYRGVTASYMGISETIIQFVLYEQFRQFVDNYDFDKEETRFGNFMLAGAGAKFCACLMTYPHEVVRTRLREENTKAHGFFGTLGQLYHEGGYRMLYRGLSVQLLRSVPNTAITMGTYEVVVFFLHRYV